LRSISTAGCASGKFIAGTRLCPPARKRAASPCAAFSASAAAMLWGACRSKGAGFRRRPCAAAPGDAQFRGMTCAYLAGPDVFLPDAPAQAARKAAICARHGITALPPLNEDVASLATMDQETAWRTIFAKDIAMMERADMVIANLTPFRGASADAGTLVELGWFLGRGKPIFAYSNTATRFAERSAALLAKVPDPMPGLAVGGFGLPDNLMIPGAVEAGGGLPVFLPERDLPFDSLEVFERCVAAAARHPRRGAASAAR
jgi:nucleoside 2-deoxyribosyltransferase